ncbi:hypothetical protein [Leptospira bandrabouensis]|uniref:hypothetical protein n=1 Tax=Leptospira bandrabouensis TaxID=2484903 RepID=UPI001EE81FDD|nr:hypothetical protein [Leptospira bandrabouensis]MCG6144511.1 hypothetical protein [Leptospira bandrabouensis]MCG6160172.1 hypothetical protein [Leptospira bandrabouensis]MCG6164105.1 hypothetical protein [Leptospira bandrabouensis]
MKSSLAFILFCLMCIAFCKSERSAESNKIASTPDDKLEIKFDEVIIDSKYSFQFFARGNKGCWYSFEKANYRDFDLLKVPPKPGFFKHDLINCSFFIELKTDATHTWYSSDWYGEYPKTFTKMTCKRNQCEFEFGNSSLDGDTFTPKKGVIKFIILDDKHIELVDYPKDIFTEVEDIRGIYRYFPSDRNLPGETFCQMDKDELLKNRNIYPPKKVECINPDDIRNAVEMQPLDAE